MPTPSTSEREAQLRRSVTGLLDAFRGLQVAEQQLAYWNKVGSKLSALGRAQSRLREAPEPSWFSMPSVRRPYNALKDAVEASARELAETVSVFDGAQALDPVTAADQRDGAELAHNAGRAEFKARAAEFARDASETFPHWLEKLVPSDRLVAATKRPDVTEAVLLDLLDLLDRRAALGASSDDVLFDANAVEGLDAGALRHNIDAVVRLRQRVDPDRSASWIASGARELFAIPPLEALVDPADLTKYGADFSALPQDLAGALTAWAAIDEAGLKAYVMVDQDYVEPKDWFIHGLTRNAAEAAGHRLSEVAAEHPFLRRFLEAPTTRRSAPLRHVVKLMQMRCEAGVTDPNNLLGDELLGRSPAEGIRMVEQISPDILPSVYGPNAMAQAQAVREIALKTSALTSHLRSLDF